MCYTIYMHFRWLMNAAFQGSAAIFPNQLERRSCWLL